MDFLPLAVFLAVCVIATCYEDRTHYQRGKSREWIKENCAPIQGKFFLIMGAFFTVLGLISLSFRYS